MIYITGDMHGDKDRFKKKNFKKSKLKKLKKGDTLIICGDFGFIWDGSDKEKKNIEWIGKRKYNVLFVAGTHENFDLLDKYNEQPFCGGMAKTISGNLKLLSNGYIFNIEGKNIFTFGGGESDDREYRIKAKTWYKQEMPDQEQIDRGKKCLDDNAKQVDFIVTHDAPTRIKNFLLGHDNQTNELQIFFDWILNNCKYDSWFLGKYHFDRVVSKSIVALYKNTVCVTNKSNKRKKRDAK